MHGIGHGHDHDPGHGPGHAHAPDSFGSAFAIGATLNGLFVIAEVGFGLWSHSLALLADAGHNLGDVFGLLLAWGAVVWSRRRPTGRHTYGLRRSSVLAALANAVLLLTGVGIIAFEAVRRFSAPAPLSPHTMIWVSVAGIAVNLATAALFASGRKGDLNVRAAYLHMAADAALSAGVVVAGVAIVYTGWLWLDPVASLLLVAVIVVGTWRLLRESLDLALDAVPRHIDAPAVEALLRSIPGVVGVHHVHIWGMSTTETALTAHVVLAAEGAGNDLLHRINDSLREKFQIGHATIQLEAGCLPECEGDGSCQCGPSHDHEDDHDHDEDEHAHHGRCDHDHHEPRH